MKRACPRKGLHRRWHVVHAARASSCNRCSKARHFSARFHRIRPATTHSLGGVVSGGCDHPTMPISREYARSLFADLTQSAMVPLDPDELLHMPGLAQHGHVFFGDIAVRCYKHRAR